MTRAVAEVAAALDGSAGLPTWSMAPVEQRETLVALARQRSRLAELQVLDAGRSKRFHTQITRIVLQLEQGGCTAKGCDWPEGMCHVHHTTPWSHGGKTNTRDARLLCPRHHARAHDPAFEHVLHPDGSVAFHRRT